MLAIISTKHARAFRGGRSVRRVFRTVFRTGLYGALRYRALHVRRCTAVGVRISISVRVSYGARVKSDPYVTYGAPPSARFRLSLELELMLSRWLWERGDKGGASSDTQTALVVRATRTNIKADSSPLCVPRLGKLLTGCKKGLRVYDRAPSPLGRRQVNGHCLQGGCYRSRALCPVTSLALVSLETPIGHSRGNAAAGSITHQRSKLIAPEIIHHERNLKVALLNNCA